MGLRAVRVGHVLIEMAENSESLDDLNQKSKNGNLLNVHVNIEHFRKLTLISIDF